MPSRRTLFLAMAALAVAAALVGAALVQRLGHVPMGTGTALVGGPFTLINQDGQTVTDKDFSGKYMLIFFGYTYCPDVCPTELQVMTQALVTMGERAASIRPLFITIDPERDTSEVMKSYVENFGGNLIGLTGSAEQIAAVGDYSPYGYGSPWFTGFGPLFGPYGIFFGLFDQAHAFDLYLQHQRLHVPREHNVAAATQHEAGLPPPVGIGQQLVHIVLMRHPHQRMGLGDDLIPHVVVVGFEDVLLDRLVDQRIHE